MAATYTFDVFSTLDGYGSYDERGDWGGYWGKQGPELEDRRLAVYDEEQRMVFGATTYRELVEMLGSGAEDTGVADTWVDRPRSFRVPALATNGTRHLDTTTGEFSSVPGCRSRRCRSWRW